MRMDVADRTRRRARRWGVLALTGVLVVAVAACRPIPLGGPTAQIGSDVSACPSFQPGAGCPTPQPMLWAAVQGPYSRIQDGDPYGTKCVGNTTTVSVCTSGSGPGGAQNPSYDPTGNEYVVEVGPADIGVPLTFQIWDAAQIVRTVGVSSSTYDCSTAVAPFNTYGPNFSTSNCQTGDSATVRSPLQVQVFDNDGVDDSLTYDTPLTGCELYLNTGTTSGTGSTANKNTWRTVCSFVPRMAGEYPLRVKASGIVRPDGTVVTDVGSGWNAFALRVTGGSAVKLQASGAMSIWTNTPSTLPTFYLAEITTEDAGKRMQLDLFDPGDGANSSTYTLQVLAPPSGAPAAPGLVPATGTAIPAPGYADTCRYNPVGSASRAPDVAAPNGAEAPNCTVTTRTGSTSVYNGTWLSIEIDIAEDYACTVHCWWTVKYDFGGASLPTDRTVWSPIIFDKPAA
jgi:hypothetical protein